ncbi:MAG TPA: beta-ketoacyl synthase N-terminal-like domain-containing protein [Stenotrophobium sp.]|jgi:3-oxoacyl-(acyl-carrier-protein) synthase|nr:beta-ketoacyl synthase N-terminal-like domain-containing protein [Stenotrophobium sp.]
MSRAPRPVYFNGGASLSSHGWGIAAAADACLQQRVPQGRVVLPDLESEISLPYCAIPGSLPSAGRLQEVAAAAIAGAQLKASDLSRTGLFIGTSSGDIAEHERHYAAERRSGQAGIAIRQPLHGAMAQRLAHACGIGGPCYTFSTACSASANALLYAAWMIREERLDHALVLGVECQNRISLLGFRSMLLVARDACRPFDAAREGIILGEAVAATVLSGTLTADARWCLQGGANLCDATHPTNPSPETIAQVIRLALADAGVAAQEIRAVKAHGTGTASNDQGEALGLRQVFAGNLPPFTSIKPVLGHTLGACGVLETLVVQGCLERGDLPATAGFTTVDPALGIKPAMISTPIGPGPVLLNFFGFGGNNCSLVMAPC